MTRPLILIQAETNPIIMEVSEGQLLVSGGDPTKIGKHEQALKGIARRGDLDFQLGI